MSLEASRASACCLEYRIIGEKSIQSSQLQARLSIVFTLRKDSNGEAVRPYSLTGGLVGTCPHGIS